MVYSYEYDSNYDPPMPQVELGLGKLRGHVELTLAAVVDSGADASVIPISILQQIGARKSERKWMRGMAGGRYLVMLYSVFLQIGSFAFYVPVVGDELYGEMLVGRDVLKSDDRYAEWPGRRHRDFRVMLFRFPKSYTTGRKYAALPINVASILKGTKGSHICFLAECWG